VSGHPGTCVSTLQEFEDGLGVDGHLGETVVLTEPLESLDDALDLFPSFEVSLLKLKKCFALVLALEVINIDFDVILFLWFGRFHD
jgi:hypothetical protein